MYEMHALVSFIFLCTIFRQILMWYVFNKFFKYQFTVFPFNLNTTENTLHYRTTIQNKYYKDFNFL